MHFHMRPIRQLTLRGLKTASRTSRARPTRASRPSSSDTILINDIVFPVRAATRLENTRTQRDTDLIVRTNELFEEKRFFSKQEELARMHRCMANACTELERINPPLFLKAMEKTPGLCFPINLAPFPTDTPPSSSQ